MPKPTVCLLSVLGTFAIHEDFNALGRDGFYSQLLNLVVCFDSRRQRLPSCTPACQSALLCLNGSSNEHIAGGPAP